ncbi:MULTISPECIES: AAA family ATPase [Moraxella]|uniref:Rad50/SbcC-type AAA domain-containing protein n=1 Tax=Moraxella lacunata TaxID=477 RepID=A0A1B8Q3H6_MORLA|nr:MULTISPECIES: AAA family ATPase [Moraxella]MBE9578467.1 AAA family ATPase [Moraxella sp. K1664]MBE9587504.1 AAA family ATPase [Moraxella sp. K1630]MBE9596000.1 AAA family ATPase [Moraxella sp. K2450]MDH9217875.1 AAA family ATPase [Moraxella lacunata]MDI4506946.1 ATP-binding cassette family protein [Moraxella lacunata]
MKILSLSFSNLNSLKGNWHIDFTDDAFVNDGLFAITGQTGAGKTTILDAICLAIYGQTPRISTISNTQNELMSVDRGDCHSEVVLLMNESAGDKLYRFSFEQRRANKKPDGKLQPIKRQISLLTSPSDDGTIIETKPSVCDKKAIEIMHMNFEQFTRSVMLAQGNFSAFLKAEANEKGEILEQITGTHIYAKISQKAFDVHKQKKEELHQLEQKVGDIDVMDDEHFSALERRISDDDARLRDTQTSLQHLDTIIGWHQAQAQAQAHITKHQADIVTAQTDIQAFGESATRLRLANLAHELSPIYQELTRERHTLTHTHTALTELQNALPELVQEQQTRQAQKDNYYQTLTTHKAQYEQALPLFKQVRTLDNIIAQDKSAIDKISHAITNEQTMIANAKQAISELHSQQDGCQTTLHTINDRHEHMAHYPDIKQDVGVLSGHERELGTALAQLRQHTQKLHAQTDELHQKNQQINDKRDELRTQKEQLAQSEHDHQALIGQISELLQTSLMLSDIDNDKLAYYGTHFQDKIHRIKELSHLTHALSQHEESHRQLNGQLHELSTRLHDNAEQEQTALSAISALNEQITQEQNTLSTLQQHYDAQQQLIALKEHHAKLTDNEPCPLCGSLLHPYALNNPFIHDIDDSTKTAIAHTTQKIETHKENLQAHKETLANITSAKVYYGEQQQTLTAQKNEIITNINRDYQTIIAQDTIKNAHHELPTALDDNSPKIKEVINTLNDIIHQTLASLTGSYDNYHTLQHAFTQKSQELSTLRQNLDIITQDGKALKNHIQIITEQTQDTKSAIADYEQSIHELIHAINTKLEPYQKVIDIDMDNIINVINNINNNDSHISLLANIHQHIGELTQISQDHDNYHAQKQQLESELSHIQIHLINQTKQLNDHQEKLHELEQEKISLTQHHDSHTSEREALFGTDNVDDKEATLRQAIDESERAFHDSQESHQKSQQALLSLNEKISHHQSHIATLDKHINELQHKFNESLTDKGFKDTDEFLSACMDNDERLALAQTEQNLHYALKQARDNLNYWEHKLDDIMTTKPNDKVLADILKDMDKQHEPNTTNDKPQNMTLDELKHHKEQLQSRHYAQLTAFGEQKQLFVNAKDSREKHGSLMNLISQKQQDLLVWAKLDELIGSKEGIKYRNFVQGLTLELMLHHANDVLSKMDSRYVLTHGDDKINKSLLEINVIDTAQGSEIRSTKNLSGGESFIVSLALAMGLSQMSSENVSINSLFLDEGFGTLDDEILDIALSVLSSLKDTGKMIGIISHVQSLKERIPTQIHVKKIANGESRLLGSGVS